jgi:superfamily II helicase
MNRYRAIKVNGQKIDEHRAIAKAEWLGFNTVVHHKDENKKNNTPGNLELMSRANHCKLHGFGLSVRPNPLFVPSANNTGTCRHCGKEKDWSDFASDKNATYGKRSICKQCVKEYKREWRKQEA